MDIERVFQKFIQKVNKNLTNDNIAVDRARFIYIFNEVQNKYVEWLLEKRNDDTIRYVEKFLVKDLPLSFKSRVENHDDFSIPNNFFDLVNLQAFGTKGSCRNKKIFVHEVKSENIEELLSDYLNKPSFKFRETFYTLSNNLINVYVDDFKIDTLKLTYYRYPKSVDISGYINDVNENSKDINPEWDDKSVDRIITACAKEFDINNEDVNKFQLDSQRLFNKI